LLSLLERNEKTSMASIIVKWQKCGKTGCRCSEGMPHGPYFWLVTYVSVRSTDKRRGKYAWKYLGRQPSDAWEKLAVLDRRFKSTFNLQTFSHKVKELNQRKAQGKVQKSTEKVLTINDAAVNK